MKYTVTFYLDPHKVDDTLDITVDASNEDEAYALAYKEALTTLSNADYTIAPP